MCIAFLNSSMDGHLGYFHVWLLMNNAARTLGVWSSFRLCFQLFGAVHKWNCWIFFPFIFNVLANRYSFPEVTAPILHSHKSVQGSQFCPHPWPTFFCFCFCLIVASPNRCEVVSHLICIFLLTSDI